MQQKMLTTKKRQETSNKQNECAYHVCNYLYWVFIETLTEDKKQQYSLHSRRMRRIKRTEKRDQVMTKRLSERST